MAGKRSQRNKLGRTTTKETHPLQSLRALFSSIQSPKGLNAKYLKRLYAALFFLSLNESSDFFYCKLKCEDVRGFSDVLFGELESRFGDLFSALHDASASRTDELCLGFGVRMEELTLLLRCCLVVLTFIGDDQKLLMEKSRILLVILSRLISAELCGGRQNGFVISKEFVSRELDCVDTEFSISYTKKFVASTHLMEPSIPWCTLMCALLEVIADELLVHKSLREYLMVNDSASSTTEILFTRHFQLQHGNTGNVLQVITAHFILSVSDEKAFENFFQRLFWCYGEDLRIPEMSLPAALSFLANPVVSSAPKTFQAYFVLLVSEAIGICRPSEKKDLRIVDYYLQAFETSVILYGRHISCLLINNSSSGDDFLGKSGLFGSSGLPTYEPFLQPLSRDKLYFLISRLNKSLDLYLNGMSSRTDSDIVAASILYVKENIHVFDESYREEIFSFMSIMITRCSSNDNGATKLQRDGEVSAQNLYLIASILKLMASSMLQAVWHIRHLRSSSCLSAEDAYSCKLYDAIVNIMHPFEQFCVHLPVQNFLSGGVQSNSLRHKESKWMLLHISGLLSLSYASRLDFLVKDCLFLLMALLNFYIIEEGGIGALGSFLASGLESSFPEYLDNVERSLMVHKRSRIFSSKTRRIQETYMRTRSQVCSRKRIQEYEAEILEYASFQNGMDANSNFEDSSETCNGEVLLKCLGNYSQADIDDIADFIECREGKDYSAWLRSRERFREWKYKRTKTLRWKRKKKHWSLLRK